MLVSAIRWGLVGEAALAAWFITISVMRLRYLALADPFSDSTLYLRGTSAWLRGENPWSVHMTTLYFAAAPPSLLPMAPFALLPEPVGLAVLFVLALAASFWTLRRLGLPWWWITWPPLVDNLWNGNPQLFIVPLLLGASAWFAPIVKAYAIVPLIIQLRLRAVLVAAVIVLVTAPLLPWGQFLTRWPEISRLLSEQSQGGMSAWFFPPLVPFAAIALVVLGRERASWWAIPALWPSTQWYYTLMALPALTPLTAAVLAAPVQGGPAVAAIVAAVELWWRARRARRARAARVEPGAET
ncbi:MAG: hypothetical protein ABI595_12840 [Actinomycetota bacterium]